MSNGNGEVERVGAEASERATYFGPVKLESYELREGHGHVYTVDDPKKLPENAIGVRVSVGSDLQSFLFHAFTAKLPIQVAPAHRYWWEGGALLWTIHAAKM